jgi:tetratricopeptide (TPR) repeat protein
MPKILARFGLAALFGLSAISGCAHGISSKPVRLSPASQALAREASALPAINAEEDYFETKLLYQALPDGSDARAKLRAKLLEYLLGPIASLDAERLRKNANLLGTEDDFQRLYDSLHDALELYSPASLWTAGGLPLDERERVLLRDSAKLILAAYSPRGNELAVATALFALQVVDPSNAEWKSRLEDVLSWLDTGSELAAGHGGPRRVPSTGEVLESVAAVWPAPAVLERLSKLYLDKQDRVSGFLRRPISEGARGLLSELLLDTEALSAMSVSSASVYLRCGQFAKAREAAARFSDRPGDDPEFRQLINAAGASEAKAADFLALARRLLPRNELLRGTSTDKLDPAAAMGVLEKGVLAYPNDSDLLVLASRVARMLSQPLLSLRYLDDAAAALSAQKASTDVQADLAAERMELAFLRLKMHIDPDRMQQAEREADGLRKDFADARARFGAAHFRLDENDIDYLLAGGLVDAGQIDSAAPLLLRAHHGGETAADVTRQLANLSIKRGEPQKAIALLQQAIDVRERNAPSEDTIPYVEGQAKLSFLLGNAYDLAASPDGARKAWAASARGWERLMLEQLRRKNLSSSAEATFEVARLYYLLGRREEGMRKFDEAIAQDEDRDQTYLDAIAFLVQRGETETAVDIYRRAIAKPGRSVSEYVKIYASLWISDLTRRSSNVPDVGAQNYLRTIADRKVMLRPPRGAAWYTQLARYAVGQIDYATLLTKADTTGKRAEAYFYEAMRRLSNGQRDQAHDLWSKVVDTKMLSFFEFEMASRYLRTGAPARPETADNNETI